MRAKRSNPESNFTDSQTSKILKSAKDLESNSIDSKSKTISESKTDSESNETLESSFLDSHSHEYFLDSHHCFVFRKKGCSPLPALPSPEKVSTFSAIGERVSLFPCLVKNAKNALLHFLNTFLTPRQGRDSKVLRTGYFDRQAKHRI
ncbi:hypothetical protein [uncultured Helicobacter sp.]|uniref:hypothetical protein n=1 Tax=uncultured Helicobacter sp. TaxID=175537 RepID=UPI00374EA87F